MWNSDNASSRNYGINTRYRVPKSPDPFWTKVQGWYNPTTFSMTKVHWICSEPKSKDDTILPPSRWPKFTGSVLNRSPRMIQSFHLLDDRSSRMIQSCYILDDRGHWITSGHMSQDDTIPLHSQGPRSLDHFRVCVKGWYNPTSFSRIEVPGSL